MTQKTVLCYGDSNTWGYVPTVDYSLPKRRYARNERWPSILQELLGNDYYVIEEGLNSRTTNIDSTPPPNRNGKTYLLPCLYSHAPLDLVILALGANDAKTYFNRTPLDIKDGLAELIEAIQTTQYGPKMQISPKILIIPPPLPLQVTEDFIDETGTHFLAGTIKKIEILIQLYEQLAREKDCFYLDLKIKPSEIDGIHYDKAAHLTCAKMICGKVKEIFE